MDRRGLITARAEPGGWINLVDRPFTKEALTTKATGLTAGDQTLGSSILLMDVALVSSGPRSAIRSPRYQMSQ